MSNYLPAPPVHMHSHTPQHMARYMTYNQVDNIRDMMRTVYKINRTSNCQQPGPNDVLQVKDNR